MSWSFEVHRILLRAVVIVAISSCISIQSHAQTALTATVESEKKATVADSSCSTQADPFEGASRFTNASQRLGGQCAFTDRYRPARLVKMENDVLSFQNFRYQNAFWRAEVALDELAIDSAIFQIKRFPVVKGVVAAHTQIRFKLRKGTTVNLINQVTGEKAVAQDILVTFEAVPTSSASYNFAYGAFPNYAFVGRVGDMASIQSEKVRPVEQYEIDLTPDERRELLLKSLRLSEQLGLDTFYNTLRPNCTTVQFDLLDQLPRLKGRAGKFLTVISTDPIASPSLDALRARGILKRRLLDYSDEMAGKVGELPIPDTKQTMPPFMPTIDGKPWSIVIANPDPSKLSESERAAFAELRSELIASLLDLVQNYGSSAMVAGLTGSSGTEILLNSLVRVQKDLQKVLLRVDSKMPTNAKTLAVYFVPFKSNERHTSLANLGVEAAIPVVVQDHVVDREVSKSKEVLYWVNDGALSASDVGSLDVKTPAYIMAAAITVSAVRGGSVVTSQALLGMNPFERPFASVNRQAAIDTAKIVKSQSRLDRATLLVSHRQELRAPLEKLASVEFGPFGGLAGDRDFSRFGTLQIKNSSIGSCEERTRSTPQLTGVLGASATGNALVDTLVAGRPVAFQITRAILDLDSLEITDMDVNVDSWPVRCATTDEVDRQFRSQANEVLKGWKKKIQEQSAVLMNLLELVLNR